MAAQGAKKVMSQEGMEAGMSKLKERQQQKEMERRQKSNELMEQGRQRASTRLYHDGCMIKGRRLGKSET